MYRTALALFSLVGSCISFMSVAAPPPPTESKLLGRVYDYKNEVVVGAQVWVSRNREVFTTFTNEQGKFIIENLPPGKVEIVAYKEGLTFGGREGVFLGDEVAMLMLDKSKEFDLRILNSRFAPVEGARLKSLSIGQRFTINVEDLVEHGFPSILSNKTGHMILPDMPQFGAISITVTHPDYAEGNLPTFPVGLDIDLVMADGIKLRGRITNAAGEGVARSRVSLFKAKDGRNKKFTEVMTDKDGFYTITALPDRYYIAAHHASYALPEPIPVWLRASDTEVIADMSLLPAHFIHGKTVSPEGIPIPLTTLSFKVEDDTIYAKTTSKKDGTFTLRVPKGKGTLLVTPPRRMKSDTAPEVPVEIKKDTDITVGDIILSPLPEIVGHVIDNKGDPVANAFVRTLNTEPPVITQSDDEGNFSLQLEQMEYIRQVSVYVEHPHRFLRNNITLDLEKLDTLKIKLKPYRPQLDTMPELSPNNLSDFLGQPAPDWNCQDWFNLPEGKESLSLADYRGKTLVLTLWAAFDMNGATDERMKELNYLHEVYKDDEDIAFLSIHDAGLKPFEIDLLVREKQIAYPIGCDMEDFDTFQRYKVNQIPQTLIIDPNGNVRFYAVDGRLHTLIKAMLRK
jgi:protocatechuate 3,4-dioxygenase beta subunit